MNFYRRFPGDYGRDTQHLTMEQHGAYNLLLDIAYTTERQLPSDRLLIYRMTRASSPSEKAAIDAVIEEFFTKTRWGYMHKRVVEEIKHAESRIEASRQNGRRGGRPKEQENPAGSYEKPGGFSKQNLEKSSPDTRLQTPEVALPIDQAKIQGAEGKPARQLSHLAREKELPSGFRPKTALEGELYAGIYRRKISDAYFDARSCSTEEQLTVCVQVGVTSLATNRAGKFAEAQLDACEIERQVLEKLAVGKESLFAVKNFSQRQQIVTGAVVRSIVEVAAQLYTAAGARKQAAGVAT